MSSIVVDNTRKTMMKPVLEHLPKAAAESFVVRFFEYDHYPTPWHFHPEYELVLVTESAGKRFIGDHISNFEPGNLALIGPNLPHLYRNDSVYYQQNPILRAKSIVVHFSTSSFGEHFLAIPETKKIQQLLSKSIAGLDITGTANKIVSRQLFELVALNGFTRWLKLLEILEVLSETKDCHPISGGQVKGINEKESERMDKVLEFVVSHFSGNISLSDAAGVANMAENSFSRYFRQRTRKTFTNYVNELRLNHAARLLVENNNSIAAVCYACGFNNLSNFNRYFKTLYGMSPLNYRKLYWAKNGR